MAKTSNKKTKVETIQAKLAFKAKATTGEGSIWHPDRNSLFWVDIEGKKLYECIPPAKSCLEWTFDRMISTVVPETENTVVVALQDEILRVNLTTSECTPIAPIPDKKGALRCNDGKCDPEGRFWIGTIAPKTMKGKAALYSVTLNGKVKTRLTGVTNSNGLIWSADKKYMYYNDTPTGRVARYAYDPVKGNIEYEGIAVPIPAKSGRPDGMTIDSNGNLWVAQWGGGGVYCYDPETGKLLMKVEVPAPHVASCAFGGKKLDTLYITTARAGLDEEQLKEYPLSGSVFKCKPGVTGVRPNYFTKKSEK